MSGSQGVIVQGSSLSRSDDSRVVLWPKLLSKRENRGKTPEEDGGVQVLFKSLTEQRRVYGTNYRPFLL